MTRRASSLSPSLPASSRYGTAAATQPLPYLPTNLFPRLEIARAVLDQAKQTSQATAWKLVHDHLFRWNVYYTKGAELENVLQAERHDLTATVYKKQAQKKPSEKTGKTVMGESSFPILSDNEEVMKKQVQDALFSCTLTDKDDFDIPDVSHAVLPSVELADPAIMAVAGEKGEQGVHQLLLDLAACFIAEFRKYDNIKLNGMEINATLTKNRVINSNGIDVSQTYTEVYIETVITSFDREKESEFFPSMTVSRISDINVPAYVQKYVQYANDVLISNPPSLYQGAVVLAGDAVPDFFAPHLDDAPLTTHTFASTHYLGLSRYAKGKPVIPTTPIVTDSVITSNIITGSVPNDAITLINNSLVPFNPQSRKFDNDGVAAKRQILIDRGIFTGYVASKRFADYLHIPPSGPLGVIELCQGSTSMTAIYKEPCVEIVFFSSFVPNALSGDFAAEIRLGYLHKDGKKIPFKGGMVSGNVFEAFAHAFFSKEETTVAGYKGPKAVRFEKLTLSGRD